MENGEIDDPFYGRNTERSVWSEDAEWCFRKEFVLPEEWKVNRRTELLFRSAGYRATIFFNDVRFIFPHIKIIYKIISIDSK